MGSADNTDDEGGGDGARSHSVQHKSLKNRSRNGPVDTDVLVSLYVRVVQICLNVLSI